MDNKPRSLSDYFLQYLGLFIIFFMFWLLVTPFLYLLTQPQATWSSFNPKIFTFQVIFPAIEYAAYLMSAVTLLNLIKGEV